MASQGPTLPGTGANDASSGSTAWTNPSNITLDDGAYATVGKQFNSGETTVSLVKANGSVGAGNKASATAWPASDTVISYGSSSDLWGDSWTPADINDSDFGAVLQVNISGVTFSQYLRASNFGFTIPGTAVINGIVLEIEKSRTGSSGAFTYRVDMMRITVTYTEATAYTVTADAGTYTLTGEDTGLRSARSIAAEVGTYVLTGQDVQFTVASHAYTLVADVGLYTLTGEPVTLVFALAPIPSRSAKIVAAENRVRYDIKYCISCRKLIPPPNLYGFTRCHSCNEKVVVVPKERDTKLVKVMQEASAIKQFMPKGNRPAPKAPVERNPIYISFDPKNKK